MKNKLVLLLMMLVLAAGANAQDSNKAATGNTTAEIGLNFNNGTFLQGGNLRFRHFMADDMAVRLGLGANYNYNKISEDANSSVFSLRIAPGIEKHFAGTEKLSPYVGAELPIGFTTASYEDANFEYRGASAPGTNANRSNFNIGLNAVAGVDYYFASHFYAGFEIGAGITYFKNSDVEVENKNNGNVNNTKGYHSLNFSPFATGGIRVGFVF
ncbi:BT1926 family outer membrane beta-barrel protein [Botryobacter ruber]|uniref:BT1926 family outer membrane beta-barrel protein n=1 Tax=Botryobacter ruber TaxID=2171629 RepID=UPI000E0A689A|nr:BT1926 family outer membrane beta-barrel protein [Botryobacter ruber]